MADAAPSLLGKTIRDARKRLGLTGEQIHRKAGIDPTSLSMWERGERVPPLKRIAPLAKILKLDPLELAAIALGRRRSSSH